VPGLSYAEVVNAIIYLADPQRTRLLIQTLGDEMRKIALTFILLAIFTGTSMAATADYVGIKSCSGCHKSEGKSWANTAHAKAFESLKKGVKVNEKKKAGLEDNDYTKDEKCLPCHTVGYGKKGGYEPSMPEAKAKYFAAIGCEMCHGAGGLYKKEMRKAGFQYKKNKKTTPRKKLIDAGQNDNLEEACNSCHMNYEGSPWKGAKAPYTPFTPKVDAKHKFDFEKAVRDNKAMHEHFKLTGIFEGEPIPKTRAEFQKNAKEPEAGEEEEEKE